MGNAFNVLKFVSKVLNSIAGIAVTVMMLMTVADVLLRAGGHPIIGTFEIVSLLLALVIGFGIPQVSLDRGHVYMDFLLDKLSKRGKDVMNTFTRVSAWVSLHSSGLTFSTWERGFTHQGGFSHHQDPFLSCRLRRGHLLSPRMLRVHLRYRKDVEG